MDGRLLDQIRQLLRPLANRIANTVARAVVELAADGGKLQLLQVGALVDETIDDAEHHQPYGFSSVPLAGAEAILVFPNGDRSHPIAVTVSDRRHRPTGGEPGQVGLYHYQGARLTMLEDGTVEIRSSIGTAQPTIKGTIYRNAEDTLLAALTVLTAAISTFAATCLGPTAPQLGALQTAVTTFGTAKAAFDAAAGTYLTTVAKLE